MNFLGKRVCITGDFSNFKVSNSNFKREEMEFYMAQLGAIISDHKKADFVISGSEPGYDKIQFAKENNIPILSISKTARMAYEDDMEILKNPEVLKPIQKQLVADTPKYLGRNVMNDYAVELLKEKLQDQKISKTWIKQFYENLFINNLPKEKMVIDFGSPKAKENALDWILKNESIESFYEKKIDKTRETLQVQNDGSLNIDKFIDLLKESLSLFSFLPLVKINLINDFFGKFENKISSLYQNLSSNKTIVLTVATNSDSVLTYEDEDYEEEWYDDISDDEWKLIEGDEVARSNRKIVLAAVSKNGRALKYADQKLMSDREIVLTAVSNDGSVLEYADDKLRADKEIVITAVSQYGGALKYTDKKFKTDKEIVLAAVSNWGAALQHADKTLKSDKEVVLAAVSQYGGALEYTDKKFKTDKEIVLAAVSQYGGALEYADEKLLKDEILKLLNNMRGFN